MNKHTKLLSGAVVALLSTGAATAQSLSGELWHVPDLTAQSAVFANTPATTPDVTFNVNFPFDFDASSASVGDWLNSGSAFNIVANTPGVLSTLMDDFTTGSFVRLTGQISLTHGQSITVVHDDGVSIAINGADLLINPGPTGALSETPIYNGPSGTFPFELVYGEALGGGAVLQITNVGAAVPETTTTLELLALSCIGLIGFRRRLRAAYA